MYLPYTNSCNTINRLYRYSRRKESVARGLAISRGKFSFDVHNTYLAQCRDSEKKGYSEYSIIRKPVGRNNVGNVDLDFHRLLCVQYYSNFHSIRVYPRIVNEAPKAADN